MLAVLIPREISQSCQKLHLFLTLTHALSRRVHIMVWRLIYSLAAALRKIDISPLIYLFFSPSTCGDMSGLGRRETPTAGTDKVHILDVNTFFMWLSEKLQGDVRMCPAVPEQGGGHSSRQNNGCDYRETQITGQGDGQMDGQVESSRQKCWWL